MRLIDADALKECIGCADAVKYGNKTTEQQHNSYSTLMMYEIADYIDDMLTVDAEPVRHGEWGLPEIVGYDGVHAIYAAPCSVCCTHTELYKPNYCPNCGAKMKTDGGKQDV